MHFTDINGIKYRINIYESFLHHRLPNGSNGQLCYYNPPRLFQGNTPYNCAYIETSSNRIVFQHRIDLIKENFFFYLEFVIFAGFHRIKHFHLSERHDFTMCSYVYMQITIAHFISFLVSFSVVYTFRYRYFSP